MDDHIKLLLEILALPDFQYKTPEQLGRKLSTFKGEQPTAKQWKQIIKQAERAGLVVIADMQVRLP